jgi:short-subunit dehydrogenase
VSLWLKNLLLNCLGATASGFQQRAAIEESKLIASQKIMDAETVAKIGYRGLMSNKTVVIPGVKNKLFAEAVRFAPRKIVRSMNNKQ